ncbi:epoxide hydrolase family protein [Cryptosporangium arvum]|uniref:Putative hydrolase or acyltransferase of alpha/beta superfamily n=1 Tax=Cryptosporangium arvum DSM 44712 TaxID=927661 RepID=A0A010ZZM6_9ACTN|nr:epoxide hydrolase family protein [Cryptosporangium arvum]EXG82677.1 putative hydrolase or acyltransferase of alpha/beta superfamily [Cryptosporangium arvum DSM 44712]
MSEITPFRIDIPQAAVDDLTDRLRRTRWVEELPEPEVVAGGAGVPAPPGWEYGVPGAYVRTLVERWSTSYDWRAQEAALNEFPQFTTEIDGQRIHFVHVRSDRPDATPLILTHGWPNTFVEYLDLVGPLTDPAAYGHPDAPAFHVVVPSLPGFAFSGPTREHGWNAGRVAAAWSELMRRLGYDRYGAHGNDCGSIVSPLLGELDRAHVLGVHVTQIFSFPRGDDGEFDGLSGEDYGALQFGQAFAEHAVHDRAQQAQPQTLAHALADSPAGQLAWSGQLFGTDLSPDTILTNAALYWFTNTAASAGRFYFENHRAAQADAETKPTSVPIGVAVFARDFRAVRRFADRDHANIVAWNTYDRGGHWAAHDAPDLLVDDIRRFFSSLR